MLLEVDCHKLDLTMHMQGSGSGLNCGPSYERYTSALHSLTKAKDEQLTLRGGLQLLEQLFTHLLTTGGVSSASNPLFLELVSEITKTKEKLQQIVSSKGY